MRASNTFPNDLEKVMDVTKDQILMALSKEPTSMDKFTEDLPKFGKIFFLVINKQFFYFSKLF